MDRYGVTLFLNIVILTVCIQSGESIKCYQCSSNSDPNCGDPINTDKLGATECSVSGLGELYDYAKKGLKGLSNLMGTDVKDLNMAFACQKTVASDGEKQTIVRSCSLAKTEGLDPCALTSQLEKFLSANQKIDFCDVCDSDHCNGASHLSLSALFVMLVPCVALVLTSWVHI